MGWFERPGDEKLVLKRLFCRQTTCRTCWEIRVPVLLEDVDFLFFEPDEMPKKKNWHHYVFPPMHHRKRRDTWVGCFEPADAEERQSILDRWSDRKRKSLPDVSYFWIEDLEDRMWLFADQDMSLRKFGKRRAFECLLYPASWSGFGPWNQLEEIVKPGYKTRSATFELRDYAVITNWRERDPNREKHTLVAVVPSGVAGEANRLAWEARGVDDGDSQPEGQPSLVGNIPDDLSANEVVVHLDQARSTMIKRKMGMTDERVRCLSISAARYNLRRVAAGAEDFVLPGSMVDEPMPVIEPEVSSFRPVVVPGGTPAPRAGSGPSGASPPRFGRVPKPQASPAKQRALLRWWAGQDARPLTASHRVVLRE